MASAAADDCSRPRPHSEVLVLDNGRALDLGPAPTARTLRDCARRLQQVQVTHRIDTVVPEMQRCRLSSSRRRNGTPEGC